MPFKPNIPQPNDVLSDSQGDLLSNNQDLNTSFSVDHYSFADTTANNGYHNTVTQPLIAGSAHPTVNADQTKIYAMQDSANVGVLQYSRRADNAGVQQVPTPLTSLQSTTPLNVGTGFTTIFDFSGLSVSMGTASLSYEIGGVAKFLKYTLYYTSATPKFSIVRFDNASIPTLVTLSTSANLLQVNNTSGGAVDIYWTIEWMRLS